MALNAGDIAIVGYNADGTDNFSFVALADIPAGEVIFFTDSGWQAAGTLRNSEGTIEWTAPAGGVTAGTVITVDTTPSATAGAVTETNDVNFSGSGDQILAYQGSAASPTFIYGLNNEDSSWQSDTSNTSDSALPTGLVDGSTAVALSEVDNVAYTGTTTGTAAELLAAISNPGNWGPGDNSNQQTAPASFTVTDAGGGPVAPTALGVALAEDSVAENGGTSQVTVSIDAPAQGNLTVTLASDDTSEGTVPATVTILDGDTSTTTTFTAVDDVDVDGTQTVTVTASAAGLTDGTDTVDVTDDDAAAPTSVLASLVFNEVLPDPNSTTNNFDTDGDGTAETADEFVELYNTSSSSLDISGLQFWDSGSDNYFTVPNGTILGPNGFIVVVASVDGGALPTVPAGSHAFVADSSLSLSNSGDNLVVYDPATDEYIQAVYNGDTADSPETQPNGDYAGFSATATLLGSVQDFGNDTDGTSLALSPDGTVGNPVVHNTIGDGSVLATPGASNVASTPTPSPTFSINELRHNQTGADNDEFFEIYSDDAGASLNGVWLIGVSGEFAPGQVDFAFDLSAGSFDADGFFLIGRDTLSTGTFDAGDLDTIPSGLNLFGSPVTYMLVEGFTGSTGDDLDTNDDGTFDTMPWTRVLDDVSLIDGDGTPDVNYSSVVVGPDGNFTFGGAAANPDGSDTYVELAFGSTSNDTPGSSNTSPPPVATTATIMEIQGSGHVSPLVNQVVTTTGIVTATIDNDGGTVSFFIQDQNGDNNPLTSDGLFINNASGYTPQIGDIVEVTGTVTEEAVRENNFGALGGPGNFQTITMIDAPSAVTDIGDAATLPTSVEITAAGGSLTSLAPNTGGTRSIPTETVSADDPLTGTFDPDTEGLDFYETLEGMLIVINDAMAVTGVNFGDFSVTPDFGANTTGLTPRNSVVNDGETPPVPNTGNVISANADENPEVITIHMDRDTAGTNDGHIDAIGTGTRIGDLQGVILGSFDEFDNGKYSVFALSNEALASNSGDLASVTTGDPYSSSIDFTDPTTFAGGARVDPPKEITAITSDYGVRQLTFGTFNVLNLGRDFGTADEDAKTDALVDQIAINMGAPDIIALQEVWGDAADFSVANGEVYNLLADLNTATGSDYVYVEIPPEADGANGGAPGSNIRVGFLYDTSSGVVLNAMESLGNGQDDTGYFVYTAAGTATFVMETAGFELGDASNDGSDSHWDGTRKSLHANFTYEGTEIHMVNNHWPSKLESDATYGFDFPVTDPRISQREDLAADIIAQVQAEVLADDVFITTGDYNSFAWETPVVSLADGLGLEFREDATAPYSLAFNGQVQELDHTLVNEEGGRAVSQYDTVHINADYGFSGNDGNENDYDGNDRVSDHDPSVGLLDIGATNESFAGTELSDVFDGLGGDDVITGRRGDDTVDGGSGDDFLVGGNGSDTLDGGAGADTLTAGRDGGGDLDVLTGGSGADIFRFSASDGETTITDFVRGEDLLNFRGAGVTVLSELTQADDGGDLVVGVSGGTTTVRLLGLAGETLDASDFFRIEDDSILAVRVLDGGGQITGSFATIQEAVDAASAGDTIDISAGTYTEAVVVDKSLTILGANAGVPGQLGSRGAESTLVGGIQVASGADNTVIDGLNIQDGALFGTVTAGVFVDANTVTVTNSLIEQTGVFGSPAGTIGIFTDMGAQNADIGNNLVSGFATGLNLNTEDSLATVTGNVFSLNLVGLSEGGAGAVDISGNTFIDNVEKHLEIHAALASDELVFDANASVGRNTFVGVPSEAAEVSIDPVPTAEGQTFIGTDNDDQFDDDGTYLQGQVFKARSGDDIINAGAGNDFLLGGAGNDTLNGGRGNDTLVGAIGDDTLTGGVGADTFRFGSADGMNTITDFVSGEDTLNLRAAGITDFATEVAISNDGTDTTVTVGSTTIILEDVIDIDQDDFFF